MQSSQCQPREEQTAGADGRSTRPDQTAGEGLTASIAGRWIKEARVALTVPAAVMMVPGVYALETLVYFDRGEILQGLSAGVLVGFVIGSLHSVSQRHVSSVSRNG